MKSLSVRRLGQGNRAPTVLAHVEQALEAAEYQESLFRHVSMLFGGSLAGG